MHQNTSLRNTTKLMQNTSYQIKIKMLLIHNKSKDNRMKYIIIKHIKKSSINKHTTKILPAKFIKMNPIQINIKMHPTKAHQNAFYQSASKCILPKHIKMHPTKAHQNASCQSTSKYISRKYIKRHPTKIHQDSYNL